jgi:hypothetical protein
MDWQLATTCFVIGLAGAYVVRRGWRNWRASKSGCGGGCCDKATAPAQPALIPVEQLVIRQRKN